MAGGQQANFGQGTLTPSTGEGEEALSGEAAASAHGLVGLNRFVPLRSRKVGGGEAVQALQGQSLSAMQGQLRQAASRALAGMQLTASRGNVVGVGGSTGSGGDNWAQRAAGAWLALRLDKQSEITPIIANDGGTRLPDFDPSPNGDGTSGSFRCYVMPADSAPNGSGKVTWAPSVTDGVVYISYRFKCTPQDIWQPLYQGAPGNGYSGNATSQKIVIISTQESSHGGGGADSAIVTVNDGWSFLSGYWYSGSIIPFAQSAVTRCGSDVKSQHAYDLGIVNPLTGVNPDTGNPWTNCEQDAARFGQLYLRTTGPNPVAIRGAGDWVAGGFRILPNQWITVKLRIDYHLDNLFNDSISMWAAHEGDTEWTLLTQLSGVRVGGATSTPMNTLWLLPYATSRLPYEGRKITGRTNNITGVTCHTVGGSTPVGNATLTYDAATKMFRFAGAGQLLGIPVSFSAANGKLLRAVPAASNGASTTIVGSPTLPITSLEVASTTGFPSSGTILAGGLALDYTGKTATTFTGITPRTFNMPAGSVVRTSSGGTPGAAFLTTTTADATAQSTTINVGSTSAFPNSGFMMVGNLEFAYTGKTATAFTGCSLSQPWTTIEPGASCILSSYVWIEIDPNLLPTTSQTDTLFIADGRPQGQFNYRDLIVGPNDIPVPAVQLQPQQPSWVPTTPWVAQDIPNSRMTDWLLDAGNPAINLPPHGSPVGFQDHFTYRSILADGGPAYSSKHHEMYLFGGGHGATANNVLVRYNLGKDNVDMSVVVQPTDPAIRVADYVGMPPPNVNIPPEHPLYDGYHSDGKPNNCHTWVQALFIDTTDEYFVPGHTADVSQHVWLTCIAAHRSAGEWRPIGYYPDHVIYNTLYFRQAGCAWLNPQHTVAFLGHSGRLRRMDIASRTWTNFTDNFVVDFSGACVAQNSNDIALMISPSASQNPNSWKAWFINCVTMQPVTISVTGYQRPTNPFNGTLKGIRNVHWIPHLNGWIAVLGDLSQGAASCAWELVFFQQTGPTSVHCTFLNVLNLPGQGRDAQRSCMVYDTEYKTLIFFPDLVGTRPLFAVKVGDTLP